MKRAADSDIDLGQEEDMGQPSQPKKAKVEEVSEAKEPWTISLAFLDRTKEILEARNHLMVAQRKLEEAKQALAKADPDAIEAARAAYPAAKKALTEAEAAANAHATPIIDRAFEFFVKERLEGRRFSNEELIVKAHADLQLPETKKMHELDDAEEAARGVVARLLRTLRPVADMGNCTRAVMEAKDRLQELEAVLDRDKMRDRFDALVANNMEKLRAQVAQMRATATAIDKVVLQS
jgi:hypothetical protein